MRPKHTRLKLGVMANTLNPIQIKTRTRESYQGVRVRAEPKLDLRLGLETPE